jgi:hypothetical protein
LQDVERNAVRSRFNYEPAGRPPQKETVSDVRLKKLSRGGRLIGERDSAVTRSVTRAVMALGDFQ